MNKPLALITGVGPGTGSAMVRKFATGNYRVAMIARDSARLAELEKTVPGAVGFSCDVADPGQIEATLDKIEASLGVPSVFIHNAVGGAFGNFLEIKPETLQQNFQVNTMALLHFARRLAPKMIEAGSGAIIVTGNTSAHRGKAGFAGFAPTKAAQRILTEAIAREVGPKGVHAAYVVIDAVIDVPWTRAWLPEKPNEFFIQPSTIADEVWHLVHQERSGWSFNVEIRPFGEVW